MPEGSSGRLAVSVGQQEYERLTASWAAYREAVEPLAGPIDPVLAMQRSGVVLRSVEKFLGTVTIDRETEAEDGTAGE
ncbi:hypothetical protein J7E83_19030 [Arthrobacter sp. ISL-48]|uniref:hypothetical protein n=1 Tax=Arthrobacter sp. ISL-48 TaxID=2819110 RepID=UPI001BEA63E2|nr:hypothetical protein [Arthrobacter sp. ISL-48]MBT2534180.1 hypothetical protein [Arthrobacter sp. ISL-48]